MLVSCRISILEWVYTRCLNFKELFARNRRSIWQLSKCNKNRSHNLFFRKRTPNHLAPFTLSMQTLNVDFDFTQTLRYNIKSMTQIREKWNSLVLVELIFEWYEGGAMVFRILVLFFLFRINGKKEHLDENDFRHGYGNCFESSVLKVTWHQMFQVLS